MKKPFAFKTLGVAFAAVSCVVAPPMIQADNDDDDDDVRVTTVRREVVIRPEVTRTFVEGYAVPTEYHTHFTSVPLPENPNVVVRYRNGRAYYMDTNDWKIVKVVTLNPATVDAPLAAEVNTYVPGYSVPVEHRTHFVDLPPPPTTGVTVRYYNGTAYYMDPSYKIVRTVRLNP